MDKLEVIQSLFDQSLVSVFRVFATNPDKQFYLREAAGVADVPVTSTFRIIHKLLELKLIKQVDVNKFKLYQFDKNDTALLLAGMLREKNRALDEFLAQAKQMPGIRLIILHGQETEKKASVLLLGENILQDRLRDLKTEIMAKYDFNINYMTLNSDQYEQMTSLGLLPKDFSSSVQLNHSAHVFLPNKF